MASQVRAYVRIVHIAILDYLLAMSVVMSQSGIVYIRIYSREKETDSSAVRTEKGVHVSVHQLCLCAF